MENKLITFTLMYLDCVKEKDEQKIQDILKDIMQFLDDNPFDCISFLFEKLNAIYDEGVKEGVRKAR